MSEDATPRSIRDLADPKWKGKTAIANPLFGTTLGGGDTATFYVTHDPREAIHLSARLVPQVEGRIAQSGSLAALQAGPATPFVGQILEGLGWP